MSTHQNAFCYVSDLVSGLMKLMNTEAADIHMPVNMGNPDEVTMKEIADEVSKATGKTITIKYIPMPQDDPKQRRSNIDRAKSLLDWTPTVALAEGLKKTVAFFDKVIKAH